MIVAPGPTIDVHDLPESIRLGRPPAAVDEGSLTLAAMERRHIKRALDRAGGNRSVAARRLGVDRGTLNRKLRQWETGPTTSDLE
jgi:two-component system response regulator HydG